MTGNIETHVIERFLRCYGEPKHTDPDGFMAEYVRCLYGTPTDVLIAAINRVVDEHRSPIWPGIRTIREAICEAIRNASRRPAPAPQPQPTSPLAKPAPMILDGKSVEELLIEHRARMEEIGAANKAARRNVALPSVNRDAWEARHGKQERAA